MSMHRLMRHAAMAGPQKAPSQMPAEPKKAAGSKVVDDNETDTYEIPKG